MRSTAQSAAAHLVGKCLLVTGAAGYIASSLVCLLADVDCHIRLLSRGALNLPDRATSGFDIVRGDVRDPAIWGEVLRGVDVVFHLAGQTSVRVANADPLADRRANVDPIVNLLEACRNHGWHPTVLFAGTETQAGLPKTLPVDESHVDRPITVYDLHKLMAEQYLEYYARQHLVDGVTLRLTCVYGPGPSVSAPDRGVLNLMVGRAIAGEVLQVYGDGDVLRDYVHVWDVARAFVAASSHLDRLNGRHFLVGSGEGHTVAEAIHLVSEVATHELRRAVPVLHVDPPAGALFEIDARNFVADPRRFHEATGWRPSFSLEDGLRDTVLSFTRLRARAH